MCMLAPFPGSHTVHGNLGMRCVYARGGEERGMGYLQFSLIEGADHHLQAAVAHVHKRHVARLLVLSWQILLVKPVREGSWRSYQWGMQIKKRTTESSIQGTYYKSEVEVNSNNNVKQIQCNVVISAKATSVILINPKPYPPTLARLY